MVRRVRFLCASLALAVELMVPLARAAGDPASLKASADASFDARSYAAALEQYQAALSAGGDPRVRYNIAQTLTALERYPEALASYQAFLAEAPSGTLNAAQREKFFALLDELKGKIARVTVSCGVPGARVLVRETAVGTTPLAPGIAVNAGPAKVEVLAEGYKPFVSEVVLAGGTTVTVSVPLERIDFTGALSVKSAAPATHVMIDGAERGMAPLVLRLDRGAHVVLASAHGYVDESNTVMLEAGGHAELSFNAPPSPDYTVAYAGFGVGLAGIAVGSVTGILALTSFSSAKSSCDTSTKECGPAGQPDLQTSKTYGILSSVAFGVGAAGVGVGVYGIIRARRREGGAPPVELVLLPGGLRVQGTL